METVLAIIAAPLIVAGAAVLIMLIGSLVALIDGWRH